MSPHEFSFAKSRHERQPSAYKVRDRRQALACLFDGCIQTLAGARMVGAIVLALVAGCGSGCAQADRSAPAAELEAAMAGFVAALLDEDVEALVGYFPSDGQWTLMSTIGGSEARSRHDAAQLRRALETRTDLYESLVQSEAGGDTLRDWVQMGGRRAWRVTGAAQFSPPDVFEDPQRLFVRWRQERGRWVIDIIGAPFA